RQTTPPCTNAEEPAIAHASRKLAAANQGADSRSSRTKGREVDLAVAASLLQLGPSDSRQLFSPRNVGGPRCASQNSTTVDPHRRCERATSVPFGTELHGRSLSSLIN